MSCRKLSHDRNNSCGETVTVRCIVIYDVTPRRFCTVRSGLHLHNYPQFTSGSRVQTSSVAHWPNVVSISVHEADG
ncbi:hypothetical protein J6590_100607, partial [Homalodisca vitripennis]